MCAFARLPDRGFVTRNELMAEIRRLRGILSDYSGTSQAELMGRVEILKRENDALGRMLTIRIREHRKCPKCTGTAILDGAVGENWYWAKCQRCGLLGLMRRTGADAWAAWDGVEG